MAGSKGESDDGLIVLAVVLAGVVLLAMLFAKPLQSGVWALLRTEAQATSLFSPLLPTQSRMRLERWMQRLDQPPPKNASISTVATALTIGGSWLRWPLLVLFGATGIWLIARSPTYRYTRTLDFESLLLEQAKTFVRVRPVLWLRAKMTPASRGNYTRALAPYEWAQSVGAIAPSADSASTERSWDARAAETGFSAQLGSVTLPLNVAEACAGMQYHEKLLFAAFAARVLDRKADSDRLFDAYAIGFGPVWSAWQRWSQRVRGRAYYDWPANGPWSIRLTSKESALVTAVVKAAISSAEIIDLVARHAFVRTLLPALLERAQTMHGILTTTDFRWVKAVDRPLHYALNDVGRRVASAEASGIRSHLQAEREARTRLAKPNVAAAVEALRIHLDECSWEAPPLFDTAKFAKDASDAVADLAAALEAAEQDTRAALEAGATAAAA